MGSSSIRFLHSTLFATIVCVFTYLAAEKQLSDVLRKRRGEVLTEAQLISWSYAGAGFVAASVIWHFVIDNEKFTLLPRGYGSTRSLVLRSVAAIYAVAFTVAYNQWIPLLGRDGLLPVDMFLERAATDPIADSASEFWWLFTEKLPTLLWLNSTDEFVQSLCLFGLFLASTIVIFEHKISGWISGPMFAVLWVVYGSLVHTGQLFYGYGWESQLLETGWLAAVLAFPGYEGPKLYLFRWLLFRIMLGAGLIKVRGDTCWRDLTCMEYHYKTQPIPNMFSWYFHNTPKMFHAFEVLVNHVVELFLPWFLLSPVPWQRRIGGIAQVGFQGTLILSGNLSFLNWLTAVPALACFDDRLLSWIGGVRTRRVFTARSAQSMLSRVLKFIITLLAIAVVVYGSVAVLTNLRADRQAMNRSFDYFRLVNTYGAFGSVTRDRDELVIEATDEATVTKSTKWHAYDFDCKMGLDPKRRPCWLSPYHNRFLWQMWFASFQDWRHNAWLLRLMAKILARNPTVLQFFATSPGPDFEPKFVRVARYAVQYTSDPNSEEWYTAVRASDYTPVLSLQDKQFRSWLKSDGYLNRL